MRTSEAVDLFLKSRRERMLSENSIYLYQWAFTKLEIEFPNNLPTTQDELQPLFDGHSNLALASQRTIRDRLRIFWGWMCAKGICESNPMPPTPILLKRPTTPRFLTEEETERLLSAAVSERECAVLAVLLDTGLRVGELASLTPKNARPNGLTVSGKVGVRFVPIPPNVYELLTRQGDRSRFWIGRKGPLTRSGLHEACRF